MSTNGYKGWHVPERVIIVAKEVREWTDGKYIKTNKYQGYVVDANNKDMLASAHNWAAWTECVGPYDPTTHTYANVIEHNGTEFLFENEGFTLELLDSANGSSQGGKLSFWNCKVSKDGKDFIVGINADYLLEILLNNDFKNGVCQSTLSFARCKGGVGMMNEAMPSYQQFLQDELKRAAMKKGKTKKREPGHLYSTLTGGNVYFSTFYDWYNPVYKDDHRRYYSDLIGFKKLDKPIVYYWQPQYNSRFTKKSEYFAANFKYFWLDDNTPARTDSGIVAEIDISDEELLDKIISDRFGSEANGYIWSFVGLSLNKDNYTMPDSIRKFIEEKGYKVWD